MEGRILVPEGMLDALHHALCTVIHQGNQKDYERAALAAALRWLSENPIVPSHEQRIEMTDRYYNLDVPATTRFQTLFAEWQRRMFLAEPEVPEPEVRWPDGCVHGSQLSIPLCDECTAKFEAFHRGQKSKERR